ncbi:MAG: hypothetical protein AAFP20_19280 [Cyanobacteria bacterium J06614_10]
MQVLLNYIPLVMGLLSFIGGVAAWYKAEVRRRYGAERDTNHLKTAYEGLATNVGHLDQMLDQRLDAIQREHMELKSLLQLVILKLGGTETQGYPKAETRLN